MPMFMPSGNVVIVETVRTPIGIRNGMLASVPASDLAATCIRQVTRKGGPIRPDDVDFLYVGQVNTAHQGQSPPRIAGRKGGLPDNVGAVGVEEVCGSGGEAIYTGGMRIFVGESRVVICVGVESASRAPITRLNDVVANLGLGDPESRASFMWDGLTNPYDEEKMGFKAEAQVRRHGLTRQQLVEFSWESYRRARAGYDTGRWKDEIVPVAVAPDPNSRTAWDDPPRYVDRDEEPFANSLDLRSREWTQASFGGLLSAATSSGINDGAAAVVLANEDHAREMGWPIRARLVAYAHHALDPNDFPDAPIYALGKIYEKMGISTAGSGRADRNQDMLYEINEAFASVPLAAMKEWGLDHEIVNVSGGAVALGHPIGCSAARTVVTLVNDMRHRGKKRGISTACIGGGRAIALGVELLG